MSACWLVSGTIIAYIFAMETKLTKMNIVLDLPIKSAAGNQRSASTFNPTNEAFPIGIKRKFSSDDSSVKEQSDGFEKALKKKINVDDDVQSKENGSDEFKETKDGSQEVWLSSDQVVNIVVAVPIEQPTGTVESAEQVAVQASISDTADLPNEDPQATAQPTQPQNAAAMSDNNSTPETQPVSNIQTSSQQAEQRTSDIENQKPAPIADTNQNDLPKAKFNSAQLPQNDQLLNKNETPQNKLSDLKDQTDQQVAPISTKVEDSVIKNTSETNSPVLNENPESQEESQTVVTDTLKQAENLSKAENISQTKITDNNNDKPDQIKSVKNNQDSAPKNDTRQVKPNQPIQANNKTQQLSNSTESPSSSDNNTIEVKSNNTVEIGVTAKLNNVQQHISIETGIPTNVHQSESNRGVSQAQNIENLSQSVAKQMQESVNVALNRNQDQITINLNPPELGRVTIKFIENKNQISGILQVSKPQIRAEIENALPQIIRNLEASGINVKRIDVEVYNQTNINQQPSKDPGFQGNYSAQQDSAHNQSNSNHTANTSSQSNKAHAVSEENTDNYQLNSALGSGSINLFA